MSFQLYNLQSARIPLVIEHPVAEDEAFHAGALLSVVDGEFVEVTDPVAEAIEGIALARYGIDGTVPYVGTPSFDITGGLGMNPGQMQALSVTLGNREKLYSAEYVGTLPTAIGGSYGVVRDTDGRWRVDFAETTDVVVRLESLAWTQDPISKNRVVVSFLAAAVEGEEI
jgi:hypothetical protein